MNVADWHNCWHLDCILPLSAQLYFSQYTLLFFCFPDLLVATDRGDSVY